MLRYALLLAALFALSPFEACAEFYKLNPLTYAAPDQHTGIVLTTGRESTGVFISVSTSPVSVQALNPTRLSTGESTSVFLQYDPLAGRYTKLILGNGKQFSIQGNVSLVIATKGIKVRVAIDHSGSTSYLTVVSQHASSTSILGLAGNQPILNLSGDIPVSLLEANKLQGEHQELHPYEIRLGQEIFLDGKRFDGTRIGIELSIESPCLQSGVSIRESTAVSSHSAQLSDYLVLNAVDEDLIALHYTSGKFGVIRPVTGGTRLYCVFTPVDLASRQTTPPAQ